MGLWFMFIWWLATSIAAALLYKPTIENARPSGLDDFQVPTATEGRVVPLIVGKVKMSGPNVIWYGDLTTTAIEELMGDFFGIGGEDVTLAYEYQLSVQMALSRGPIDGHDRIWMNDEVIKSGESTGDVVISDLEFFGGFDGGRGGGGIDFTLEFLDGSQTTVNPYLATQYSPTPAYVNTAYMLLKGTEGGGGYIGNTSQLRYLAFELFWYPNSLAVTGGKERIGDDANPICFLYELLVTNDDWGIQIGPDAVLVTGTEAEGALRAVAERVADEGLGFSMVIDGAMEARQIITEIERHVDGAFRIDVTDGKFKVILARPPVVSVPLLDESNIVEMMNFARGNWAETKNELRVGYADRAKEYQSTFALDQDLANREITGVRNVAQLAFPGCKTASVAQIITSRELLGLQFPVAKTQLRLTRAQYKIQRGDPFDFTWPDEDIFGLGMRVTKVRYGTDVDGEITIDAVEDIFRLQTAGFEAPPDTDWIQPDPTPLPALDERLWQVPLGLSEGGLNRVATLAVRDGGLHLGYDVFADLAGGTAYVFLNRTDSWTPSAQLQAAMSGSVATIAAVTIQAPVDLAFSKLDTYGRTTLDLLDPQNLILIGDEIMWFETATDNLDGTYDIEEVHRAALDSHIDPHSLNDRVWFPTHGASLVSVDAVDPPPQIITAKLLPRTIAGTLDIASAAQLSITTEDFAGYGYDYGNDYGGA